MPELPDVEIQRRRLLDHGRGKTIAEVELSDIGKLLENTSGAELTRELRGKRFDDARRLGKYLLCRLEQNGERAERILVLHFGMTGYLEPIAAKEGSSNRSEPSAGSTTTDEGAAETARIPEKTKILFRFEGGDALAYVNMRLLGRVYLVKDLQAFRRAHGIGPDALEMSEEDRAAVLTGRGGVKSTLMNQEKWSGIGNVYSDEICFQAGIHPQRRLASLGDVERRRLARAVGEVLETAIDRGADPARLPRTFLTRYRPSGTGAKPGEEGEHSKPPFRIEAIKAGGRTAYISPDRQPPDPDG
jgi:formamidopyrimidine-DNA glycosylase